MILPRTISGHLSISVLPFLAFLFTGCFTESPITKDETVHDDTKAFFYLKDGSYVRSFADYHQRTDSSYRVWGTLFMKGESVGRFEGVLPDSSITKITRYKFNWIGTLLVLPLATLVVAGAVLAASEGSFPH